MNMPDISDQQPVLVLMGVSGCGKSTVAALLAGQLGWDFQEGDDLHSEANVEKMASGQPLTDDDRRPWLDAVASWIRKHDLAGIPGIVTCSALKRSYRDRLRGPHVVFIYLAGSNDEIRNRLSARMNHYMPSALLDSQLACLEPPAADERVITIGVGARPAEIAAEIIQRLALRPEPFSSALGASAPGHSSAP
jgi:gluconokinase